MPATFAQHIDDPRMFASSVMHTFRNMAATWGVQAGVDIWERVGTLGTNVEVLAKRHGHHSSDHMDGDEREAEEGRRLKDRSDNPEPKHGRKFAL